MATGNRGGFNPYHDSAGRFSGPTGGGAQINVALRSAAGRAVNTAVRRDMAGQDDEIGKIRHAASVAARVESVEAYHTAGAQVMAAVNATPEVMGMRAKLEQVETRMQQKPPAEWSAKDSQDVMNARLNLGIAIRGQAIDLIGKLRPMATQTDVN